MADVASPISNGKIFFVTSQSLIHSSKYLFLSSTCIFCLILNFLFLVTHTPKNFLEFYNELWSIRDQRVDGWFMMSSIWPTVSLCVFYWYCSIVLG